MKVLHLVGTLNPGGIERLVTELVLDQGQNGITPAICCLIAKEGKFLEQLEGRIAVFEARSGKMPWLLTARLAHVLHTWQPDIIHSHVNYSLLWQAGALFFSQRRVPFVITQHTLLDISKGVSVRSRVIYRVSRPLISRHIAVSEFAAHHAARLYGLQPEAIGVISNGVSPSQFRFDLQARRRLRQELGISEQAVVCGSVGRLARVKGYDILLPAIAKAATALPGLQCIIAGSGPQEQELRDLAASLGCTDSIHLLGSRQDIADVLSAMDVYVQPSRNESAGRAVLEALVNGLPVIASNVGGLSELAKYSLDVILFPSENPERLAKLVQQTMAYRDLNRDSRCPAMFTFETMSQAYLEVYRNVLA